MSRWRTILKYLMLGLIAVVMLFPLFWMFALGATSLSGALSLQNFASIFSADHFGRYLLNSLLVAIVVTAGNIVFCFMSGYAMARRKIACGKFWFYTVLIVLMVPVHIVIIPMYIMMSRIGLYDSYGALIIPWLVSPIGIFLVRQ
jgi:ABC-type glycerol-3-phosphate transport system permease component